MGETFATLERRVLRLLAERRAAGEVLRELALGLEALAAAGTLASVLIIDENGALREGASPHVPAEYSTHIEGLHIGPATGSCGTAAYRRQPVVVEDIATDPLWHDYRDEALAHGLRACWSVPILSTTDEVLGTFAFYYRDPRRPSDVDLAIMDSAARLARIVLEHERAERARLRSSRRKNALFAAATVLAVADDVDRAMNDVLRAILEALAWRAGAVWLLDQDDPRKLVCAASWAASDMEREFIEATCAREFRLGEGLPGRVCAANESLWILLRKDDPDFPRAEVALAAGLSQGVGFPISAGTEAKGVIELFTGDEGRDDDLLVALRTIGLQVSEFLRRSSLVEELRETVRFSELFSGVLAHDLRNPLNALVMGTDLLLNRAPDDRSKSTLERMRGSGRRMARLIDQLLDVTRSRSGNGIAIHRAPMSLGTLVTQLVHELALAHPERTLGVSVDGDAGGEWDHDRLAQVVSNLVGNAIHHSSGPIEIFVDGTGREEVVFSTHNLGTIPADKLGTLFDPFRSANPARARQSVGLGLYITKLVVSAHGGDVEVQSDEEGTTFRARLPRKARSEGAE